MTGFTGVDRSYFYGGGLPPPLEREINVQFEPGALINLAAAGIAKADETIDAQILAGMSYGRNATQASKPTLEFPIENLRMLRETPERTDTAYREQFEKLLNLLPEDLRTRLYKEMQALPGERDPVFASLSKTLAFAALALAWSAKMPEAYDPNSAIARFSLQNLALADEALLNLIAQGNLLLARALAYLKKAGPNHPEYEDILRLLKEASHALKMLKRFTGKDRRGQRQKQQQEEQTQEPKRKSRVEAMEASLVEIIERDSLHARHRRKGSSLLILDQALKAMELVGKMQTLKGGLPSLLFGCTLAAIGIDSGTSQAGLIGPSINRFLQGWAAQLGAAYLTESSPGGKLLFPALMSSLLAGTMAAAVYALQGDLHKHDAFTVFEEEGLIPEEKEQLLANLYMLWNFIAIALKMEIAGFFIADPLKESPKKNLLLKEGIELIAIALIAKIASQSSEEAALTLIGGLSGQLISRLNHIETSLNTLDEDNEGGEGVQAKEGKIKQITLQLAHCRLQLEHGEPARWDEAFNGLIALFDVSIDAFDLEMEELHLFLKKMIQILTVNLKDFKPPDATIAQI